MVAAGVLLIGRVYPLLQKSEFLLGALTVIGAGSILVGGLIALTRDVLKQLLAYSHDLAVRLRGLYVRDGRQVRRDGGLLLRDSPCPRKERPVPDRRRRDGGYGREPGSPALAGLAGRMPLLAVSAGATAAGLAALPLTIGFFKDELLFGAALESKRACPSSRWHSWRRCLTLTYTWKFWSGIFLGDERNEVQSHTQERSCCRSRSSGF